MPEPITSYGLLDAPRYTNSPLLQRYAKHRGLGESAAHARWEELLKFLALCATNGESYSPSPDLDELWHEFILDTQEYARFCETYLGVFIHHIPTDDGEPERYEHTIAAMERAFGAVNRSVWPAMDAAKCNGKGCRSCKSCRGIVS